MDKCEKRYIFQWLEEKKELLFLFCVHFEFVFSFFFFWEGYNLTENMCQT